VPPTTTTLPPTTTVPPTTTTVPPTTTTLPPRFWDGYERLNIILLGSDAGVGRIGTRTDTMLLFSIDPESGDAVMVSIPRNFTEAPLPEGMGIWGCDCFPDILTHLWANAEWYPDAFPGPQEPPVNALKSAIGMIFDLDIHYYAKVDLAGFVEVIDALGGVTIDAPKRIRDHAYPHEYGGRESVSIDAGIQHLDGHLTLAYSRIRRHSGDFARMHRQRCVLGALLDQKGAELRANPQNLVAAVFKHVDTDIPIEALPDLIYLLEKVETDRVATLRITRYNYAVRGHAGYQVYDLDQIRTDVRALMEDPTIHLERQDGEGFQATCELSFD
jgi:LCP family protein required for cell wall assembly